jgi:hypothetical protein
MREMTGTEYSQRLLQYYEDMIEAQVTHSFYYPKDFRGLRDSGPEPYNGSADIDEFERWLVRLLKFFQVNKMCGRKADFLRVVSVGRYLSGEASEWYEAYVYSVDRDISIRWTFVEVIRRLFHDFIDESALQLAVRSYYQVKYSESKGVYSYIRELNKKASRLTSKPDEFTFRERFIDGLPSRLVKKMVERYDITAESSTIDQMTTAIRTIERSSTYSKRLEERRRTNNANDSLSPARQERTKDKSDKDRSHRKSRSRERRKSRGKDRREERRDRRDRGRSNRGDVRRERKFEPTKDRDRDTGKGKSANPNVTCFSCQQKGHYANDPACPMYGKKDKPTLRDRPQVRAARAETSDWTSGDEEDELMDGSQYSSSTGDDHSLSESESDTPTSGNSDDGSELSTERPRVNAITAEEPVEDEDTKYVRAVRAKVAPAIEENLARASVNRKVDRPKRTKGQETCLAGWIRINGVDALTLFDSGSNTDTISPGFAQVAKIPTRKLEQQVPLQLGTVGSRAAINYGVEVAIELGDTRYPDYYFDILNIDRYDCIAGAPLMRQFGVHLDFRDDAIYIGDQRVQALLPDEEAAILRGRQPVKKRTN